MNRKTYKKTLLQIEDFQVLVLRKRVRNYYLHVLPPDGQVRVTVRVWTSEADIKKFVVPKLPRVRKQIKSFTGQEMTVERNYENGDLLFFEGRKLPLLIQEKEKWYAKVLLQDDTIVMQVPHWYTKGQKERVLDKRYRTQLETRLPALIDKYCEIVGVHIKSWKIKKMKSVRWLAHITKKSITINLELMKKPQEALEYIIVHELVHFLEKNHTKRFYALVEHFLPVWKEYKKKLSSHIQVD